MAFGSVQTKNGSWVNGGGYNAYRAVLYYAVNSETTKVTFNSQLAVQSGEGHDSLSNFTLKLNGNKKSSSAYLSAGATVKVASEDGIVVTRNKTTQYKTLSASATGGSWSGSSTASVTITVDPLPSYAVTFNANGGTGAPTSQTKWYGETLSLSGWGTTSGTKAPTRANYIFLGWSTSSTATSATYTSSSHSYTGNAPLTLYAVWQLAAVSPTISSFSAFRSDSSGTADPSNTEYVTFKASWTVDSNASSRNIKFVYTPPGGTQQTKTVTLSDASGETVVTYACAIGESEKMQATATVTDATHSLTASRTATVSVVFKPFTMANKGLSAAFFGIAKASDSRRLRVFGNINTDGYSYNAQTNALTSASTNVSATTNGTGYYLLDSANEWISRIISRFTTSAECLMLETRRKLSGTDKYHTVYIGLDANCKPIVTMVSSESNPNAKTAWFKAIGAWTSLASTTGTKKKTFTIPTGFTELLITCKYSNTYAGSVVVPAAQVNTTETEWYLGGGVTTTNVTNGRQACCKLTSTYITPVSVRVDGSTVSATWTVYWR